MLLRRGGGHRGLVGTIIVGCAAGPLATRLGSFVT